MRTYFEDEKFPVPFTKVKAVFIINNSVRVIYGSNDGDYHDFPIEQFQEYKQWLDSQCKPEIIQVDHFEDKLDMVNPITKRLKEITKPSLNDNLKRLPMQEGRCREQEVNTVRLTREDIKKTFIYNGLQLWKLQTY